MRALLRLPLRKPKLGNRAIQRIKKAGRRLWQTESAYHRQGKVENTFFRLKTMLGRRMRARGSEAQATEALINGS